MSLDQIYKKFRLINSQQYFIVTILVVGHYLICSFYLYYIIIKIDMDLNQIKIKSEPTKYTKIRFSKAYLSFIVLQCLLGFIILIISIFDYTHMKNPLVIIFEYLLAILIVIDVYLKFKSEPLFFKNKQSIFDLVIFGIYILLLLILTFVRVDANPAFLINLQTNQMMFLTIIIGRFLTQIIRLIFYFRGKKQNLVENKHLKQIELIEKNNQSNQQTDRQNGLKEKEIAQTPDFSQKFRELKDFSKGSNPMEQENKHQILHQEL